MLEVESINTFYGRAHILHDVSFSVGDREVVALLGRNGAGKSTTMKSIMGLVRPKRGRVGYDGEAFQGRPPHQICRLGLGYVPEERRIFMVNERELDAVQWALPILFVCEDNHWQAYVHRRETMPDGAIARWAASHGLPTRTLDGNDVEAVHAAALEAAAEMRANGGPRFLELVTYRQRGHLEPDDQAYVDLAERAAWLERDPIRLAKGRLLEQGLLDAAALAAMEQRVDARIAQATAFAQASPMPAADTLLDHVYA